MREKIFFVLLFIFILNRDDLILPQIYFLIYLIQLETCCEIKVIMQMVNELRFLLKKQKTKKNKKKWGGRDKKRRSELYMETKKKRKKKNKPTNEQKNKQTNKQTNKPVSLPKKSK